MTQNLVRLQCRPQAEIVLEPNSIAKSNRRRDTSREIIVKTVCEGIVYGAYCFTEAIVRYTYQNLMLQKLLHPDSVRDSPKIDEKDALAEVAFFNSWLWNPAGLVSLLFAVAASSWSDRAGKRRKPLILIPIVQLLLQSVLGVLQSCFWIAPIYATLILYSFIELFGSMECMMQATFLCATDRSTDENRTFMLGINSATKFLAYPVGMAVSGIVLKRTGFLCAFTICILISTLNLLACILLVHDKAECGADTTSKEENKTHILDAIHPSRILESTRIVFRNRGRNSKIIIGLWLLVANLFLFSSYGEYNIHFLYFKRKLSWDEETIGVYRSFYTLVYASGILIVAVLFSHMLKLKDSALLYFCTITRIIGSSFFSFANQSWQIYLLTLIDMFPIGANILARSYLTKLVEKDEYGHLMSIIVLCRIQMPISASFYNVVYMKSIYSNFLGWAFVISAAISVFTIFIIWYVESLHKRNLRQAQKEKLMAEKQKEKLMSEA